MREAVSWAWTKAAESAAREGVGEVERMAMLLLSERWVVSVSPPSWRKWVERAAGALWDIFFIFGWGEGGGGGGG